MANFYYQIFIITLIYTRILFRCNPTPRKHEGCLPVGFFVNLTPLLVILGLNNFFESSSIGQNSRCPVSVAVLSREPPGLPSALAQAFETAELFHGCGCLQLYTVSIEK
jgi:hypothetical protein